jgi:hypothetical protein
MIAVCAIALLAIYFLPAWIAARHSSMGRAAVRAFGAIQSAEGDLKYLDLDGNGVRDYWSRDIRGLARIRAKDATGGLIDERLAAADDAYPNAQHVYGHLFRMLESDEDDRPLAGPSGFGSRYAFCMYSAREGVFNSTYMSIDREPWHTGGRHILRKIPFVPPAMGWAKAGN